MEAQSLAPKKPRAKSIARSEWEKRRKTITRLYAEEGKSLEKVMAMLKEPNFNPRKSQFKHQLAQWKLRKNEKREQVVSEDASDRPDEEQQRQWFKDAKAYDYPDVLKYDQSLERLILLSLGYQMLEAGSWDLLKYCSTTRSRADVKLKLPFYGSPLRSMLRSLSLDKDQMLALFYFIKIAAGDWLGGMLDATAAPSLFVSGLLLAERYCIEILGPASKILFEHSLEEIVAWLTPAEAEEVNKIEARAGTDAARADNLKNAASFNVWSYGVKKHLWEFSTPMLWSLTLKAGAERWITSEDEESEEEGGKNN